MAGGPGRGQNDLGPRAAGDIGMTSVDPNRATNGHVQTGYSTSTKVSTHSARLK